MRSIHYELDNNGELTNTNVFLDDKYECEVIKDQKILILRRIYESMLSKESSPIRAFDLNKITCIKQINQRNTTFFITYEPIDKNSMAITIYEDPTPSCGNLKQKMRFEDVDDYALINDRTFIIWKKSGEKFLYNIATGKSSGIFDKDTRVVFHKDIIDYIDPKYHNTVLVRQKVESLTNFSYDYVTYGIDLTDFDIVTSIWSEEQRRYIKKYNSKECKKIYEETGRDPKYFSPDDLILLSEVKRYLDELYWQGVFTICRDQEKTIISPGGIGAIGDRINEEHVKKLKRQYQYDNFKSKRIIL